MFLRFLLASHSGEFIHIESSVGVHSKYYLLCIWQAHENFTFAKVRISKWNFNVSALLIAINSGGIHTN